MQLEAQLRCDFNLYNLRKREKGEGRRRKAGGDASSLAWQEAFDPENA